MPGNVGALRRSTRVAPFEYEFGRTYIIDRGTLPPAGGAWALGGAISGMPGKVRATLVRAEANGSATYELGKTYIIDRGTMPPAGGAWALGGLVNSMPGKVRATLIRADSNASPG